jgi:hypothetical protein
MVFFLMMLLASFLDGGDKRFFREQEYDSIEKNIVIHPSKNFTQLLMRKDGLVQCYVIIDRHELVDVFKSGPYYNVIIKDRGRLFLLKAKEMKTSITSEDIELINNKEFKQPRLYNFRWW